jgi:type III pantothenate kinase
VARNRTRGIHPVASRVLAIDAGNTRVKWGLHDGTHWLKSGHIETAKVAQLKTVFSRLPVLSAVLVSNVAGAAARTALERALPKALAARWIRSAAAQCGVRNSYAKPAQLGCDRWAALIGARHVHRGAAVVVNAGTALTVDALSADGVFVGGLRCGVVIFCYYITLNTLRNSRRL